MKTDLEYEEERRERLGYIENRKITGIESTVSLIRDAYQDGMSIDNIAKYLGTGFNAKQIDAILVGFSFDLSVEDVASYSDKNLSVESMHDLRRKIYDRLQNEKRHGEKEQYRYPETPYRETNRDEYEAEQQYRYPEHQEVAGRPAKEDYRGNFGVSNGRVKAGVNGLDALLKEKKEQVYGYPTQKSKKSERTDRF